MVKHQRYYNAVSALPLLMSVLMASPAMAQDAAKTAADNRVPAKTAGIEEIVVTAQRRSENLQKVPIAITAITARALERSGTTGVNALSQVTAGLNFTNPAGQLSPFLRGVGSAASAVGNSASVASYVDGVYMPSMAATQLEFNNIERIEVLKGPQGTLFGRNSTGGVINVITKDPSFDTHVKLGAGYGNYDAVQATAYATTGLSQTVAVDFAGFYGHQYTGWSYNHATGQNIAQQNDLMLRSKLLFKPGGDTRVVLAVDYSRSNPDNGALNRPYENTLTFIPIPHPGGFWDSNINFYKPALIEQGGASLTVEQSLGGVKVRSISAYRKQHGQNTIDLDGTQINAANIDITERSGQFTQELQLLSNGSGRFSWILGGFYMNGYARTAPYQNPATKLFADQGISSISGFAQGTYEVATGTKLTAGLRYTNDSYTFNDYTVPTAGGPATTDPQRTSSQGRATWRLSADHQFGSNILGYVSYNRGFRAGTFNLTDQTAPALKPEVLDAVEAGLKTDLLDRHLRANVSVYNYWFKDIQISRADGNSQQTLNASSAKIWGVDADLTGVITDRLTVNVSGAYIHGRYGSFLNAPISTPNAGGGNTVVVGNASGNKIIRTPEVSGNVGVNYALPSAIGKFNFSANYYYNGGWYSDPDNRLKTKPYSLVSGSIGWTSPDTHYEARLWAKNLTDTKYYSYAVEIAPGDVGIQAPPRTYGVTLGVNF